MKYFFKSFVFSSVVMVAFFAYFSYAHLVPEHIFSYYVAKAAVLIGVNLVIWFIILWTTPHRVYIVCCFTFLNEKWLSCLDAFISAIFSALVIYLLSLFWEKADWHFLFLSCIAVVNYILYYEFITRNIDEIMDED